MGNRLKPFTDQLGSYLSPMVKGTILEELGAQNLLQGAFQGKECWLEHNVISKHLH